MIERKIRSQSTQKIPSYVPVYNMLYSDIINGFYKTGDILPSESTLSQKYKVSRNIDQEFIKNLVDRDEYYDKKVEDEHTGLGGTLDLRFGFAGCSLPLVLHHNTPNNSIALLWSYDYEECKIRGLFPRVRRHEAER